MSSAHHKKHISKVMVHTTVGFAFSGSPECGGEGLKIGCHRCQGRNLIKKIKCRLNNLDFACHSLLALFPSTQDLFAGHL
jgi:hypothetical protein